MGRYVSYSICKLLIDYSTYKIVVVGRSSSALNFVLYAYRYRKKIRIKGEGREVREGEEVRE